MSRPPLRSRHRRRRARRSDLSWIERHGRALSRIRLVDDGARTYRQWPLSLRTVVAQILESRHPMFLWWGPDLIQIFNDGYLPELRLERARSRCAWRPRQGALGRDLADHRAADRRRDGERRLHVACRSVRSDRAQRPVEDVWWTYGYSPVRDDDGNIGGVLVVVQETTQRVLLEQKLRESQARLVELFRHAPAFICVLRGKDHVFELTNDRLSAADRISRRHRSSVARRAARSSRAGLHRAARSRARDRRAVCRARNSRSPTALARSGDGRAQLSISCIRRSATRTARAPAYSCMASTSRISCDRARSPRKRIERRATSSPIMSHELRTPLNAIGGYAELIELGHSRPGRRRRSAKHSAAFRTVSATCSASSTKFSTTRASNPERCRINFADISRRRRAAFAAEELVKPQMIGRGLHLIDGRVRSERARPRRLGEGASDSSQRLDERRQIHRRRGQRSQCPATYRTISSTISMRDTGVGIPPRQARVDLRAVRASRHASHSHARRHRTRPRDQPRPRARHARRPARREHRRCRKHVPPRSAAGEHLCMEL